MNAVSDRELLKSTDAELAEFEGRIERAKDHLVADVDRVAASFRENASEAGRDLVRLLVMGGLLVLGLGAALMLRRRRRRLRVTFR